MRPTKSHRPLSCIFVIVSPVAVVRRYVAQGWGRLPAPGRGASLPVDLPESETRRGSRHLPVRCLNARPAGRGRAVPFTPASPYLTFLRAGTPARFSWLEGCLSG